MEYILIPYPTRPLQPSKALARPLGNVRFGVGTLILSLRQTTRNPEIPRTTGNTMGVSFNLISMFALLVSIKIMRFSRAGLFVIALRSSMEANTYYLNEMQLQMLRPFLYELHFGQCICDWCVALNNVSTSTSCGFDLILTLVRCCLKLLKSKWKHVSYVQ